MNLKIGLRTLSRDSYARWLLIGAMVLNASLWAAVLRFVPRQGSFLPLHYTIYFGINLTGNWWQMLWLPAIGLAVLVAHLCIAAAMHHRTWQQLWALLALVLNALLLIDALASIIYMRSA